MGCFGNGGGCLWIIILIILISCCCGGADGFSGCSNNSCGCCD